MPTSPAIAVLPAETSNPNRRIAAAELCDLCGGISKMTLWRWLADPALEFPRPAFIGNRRYWREVDVVAWLDARSEADPS